MIRIAKPLSRLPAFRPSDPRFAQSPCDKTPPPCSPSPSPARRAHAKSSATNKPQPALSTSKPAPNASPKHSTAAAIPPQSPPTSRTPPASARGPSQQSLSDIFPTASDTPPLAQPHFLSAHLARRMSQVTPHRVYLLSRVSASPAANSRRPELASSDFVNWCQERTGCFAGLQRSHSQRNRHEDQTRFQRQCRKIFREDAARGN